MAETPESKILKDVRELLREFGFFHLRLHSGTVKVRGGYMHLCPEGTPDLEVIDPQSRAVIWIETKRLSGKQREAQIKFQNRAEARGERYLLARSIDDVIHGLRLNLVPESCGAAAQTGVVNIGE